MVLLPLYCMFYYFIATCFIILLGDLLCYFSISYILVYHSDWMLAYEIWNEAKCRPLIAANVITLIFPVLARKFKNLGFSFDCFKLVCLQVAVDSQKWKYHTNLFKPWNMYRIGFVLFHFLPEATNWWQAGTSKLTLCNKIWVKKVLCTRQLFQFIRSLFLFQWDT